MDTPKLKEKPAQTWTEFMFSDMNYASRRAYRSAIKHGKTRVEALVAAKRAVAKR